MKRYIIMLMISISYIYADDISGYGEMNEPEYVNEDDIKNSKTYIKPGYVTPMYYITNPASQNITQNGLICSKSKYFKSKKKNYASDFIITECLGADVDAMHDRYKYKKETGVL